MTGWIVVHAIGAVQAALLALVPRCAGAAIASPPMANVTMNMPSGSIGRSRRQAKA